MLKGQEFEKANNPELKYLAKIGAKLIFGSGSTNYSSLEEAEKAPQKIIEKSVKKEMKRIEKTLTISDKSYDKDLYH